MKWFFGLSETSKRFQEYAQMVKVAVYTAYLHTSLEPCPIYDGDRNELTDWLETKGVTIIPHRSAIYNQLRRVADLRGQERFINTGSGAYLRVDIPQIMHENQWGDEFVLYTDIDVMFAQYCDFNTLTCDTFAVGPEFFMEDYININSGVMLMNIPFLYQTYDSFIHYIENKLEAVLGISYDQMMYRTYYHLEWDNLDPLYNWKPYWGAKPDAKIIHFHGPKPTQQAAAQAGQYGDMEKSLYEGDYFQQAGIWNYYLEACDNVFSFREKISSSSANNSRLNSHPNAVRRLSDAEKNRVVINSDYRSLCQSSNEDICDWRAVKGSLALDWYLKGNDMPPYLALINFLTITGDLEAVWAHMKHRGLQSDPHLLKFLGIQYYHFGDHQKAKEFLEKSLEVSEDIDVLVSLGKLHYINGEYRRAMDYLQRAAKINPDDADAQEGLILAASKLVK